MKYLKLFESFDDSDTMAKFQIMDSDTQMAFDFNKEYITDPEHIKDLIEKYNHFYLEEESWGGGPPPKGFVDYFNQKYSKTKPATQKTFYPTIDLIIQTGDYGKLIIGFSIRDKSFKLYNWGSLGVEDPTEYDDNVLTNIDKFVKDKLNKMTLDEVVSYLNLNIKNKIDWNWID
jgi:hypothetical protein